jgi:hypothetical protein
MFAEISYDTHKVDNRVMWLHNYTVEKLTVAQLVKKFSICYGTRTVITVFTRASHWYKKRFKSLRGPRLLFSAGPQGADKWGGARVSVTHFTY